MPAKRHEQVVERMRKLNTELEVARRQTHEAKAALTQQDGKAGVGVSAGLQQTDARLQLLEQQLADAQRAAAEAQRAREASERAIRDSTADASAANVGAASAQRTAAMRETHSASMQLPVRGSRGELERILAAEREVMRTKLELEKARLALAAEERRRLADEQAQARDQQRQLLERTRTDIAQLKQQATVEVQAYKEGERAREMARQNEQLRQDVELLRGRLARFEWGGPTAEGPVGAKTASSAKQLQARLDALERAIASGGSQKAVPPASTGTSELEAKIQRRQQELEDRLAKLAESKQGQVSEQARAIEQKRRDLEAEARRLEEEKRRFDAEQERVRRELRDRQEDGLAGERRRLEDERRRLQDGRLRPPAAAAAAAPPQVNVQLPQQSTATFLPQAGTAMPVRRPPREQVRREVATQLEEAERLLLQQLQQQK